MSSKLSKSTSIWKGNKSLGEVPPSIHMVWNPEDEPDMSYYYDTISSNWLPKTDSNWKITEW